MFKEKTVRFYDFQGQGSTVGMVTGSVLGSEPRLSGLKRENALLSRSHFFFKVVLPRYNSHPIHVIHLKIQLNGFLVYSQILTIVTP